MKYNKHNINTKRNTKVRELAYKDSNKELNNVRIYLGTT